MHSMGDAVRLGAVRALDAPALRTTVPVTVIHRRKGYLSPAARALLALMSGATLRPSAGRAKRKVVELNGCRAAGRAPWARA